ncbi:MAG: hypothetical protein VW405_07850 [Rhodospirillaceae bacterium]
MVALGAGGGARIGGDSWAAPPNAAPPDDRVWTSVEPLDDRARKEEIARMLAGATITDEARAAAGSLLAGGEG